MSVIDIAIVVALSLAADAGQAPLQFPEDEKTLGPDGYPVFVDDNAVASRIPWVKQAGARLSTCMSGATIPEYLTIHYAPTVIGAHVAETNVLRCEHEHRAQTVSCDAAGLHDRAFFDSDPTQYFYAESTLTVADALPVIHAIVGGELSFADGVKDPKLGEKKGRLGMIAKDGAGFTVRYGDCGCSGTLQLHRDAAAGKFVVTQAGWNLCV